LRPLRPAFALGQRLIAQPGRRYQFVTVEAAVTGRRKDRAGGYEDVSDLPCCFVNGQLGADLNARDQVLVDKRVEYETALDGVACEDEEVHIGKQPGRGYVEQSTVGNSLPDG
jgi:hypothetical protein